MTGVGHNIGGVPAAQLLSFVERVERLEEEKRAITDDIKDVKQQAKSVGFDVPTINAIVKLRRMSEQEREEKEALLDLYKAALGMLNGTPLGEAAIRRASKKPEPKPEDSREGESEAVSEDEQASQPAPVAIDPEEGRHAGAEAAAAGKPVTSNPFPAGDPRRAAFDEAWCQAAGSDGMDIPEAFRRSPKPKKPQDSE
jgi:uncharacterized protein (UPF0335 family)